MQWRKTKYVQRKKVKRIYNKKGKKRMVAESERIGKWNNKNMWKMNYIIEKKNISLGISH